MTEPLIDRTALTMELERFRTDFHHLLDVATDDDWRKPTSGTRWTNEQLLLHMVFGYTVVQRLLFLVRVFGHLPQALSRRFAQALNAATRPFHAINFYGSCLAARVYNRNRMGPKLDRVIDSLGGLLICQRDNAFRRGMHGPTRWDPYFEDYMTLADIYRYPGQHYDHHRRQLTIGNLT
ncbi:DinB family protein [Mycobacterium sp. 852014-52144_SCH5372336]|uniref:DinB family protein n=1 Tax=Mycobacterium sp. 852014-52144_SCH5372336 TaxID=1834115 RepID=UPI0007FF8CC1|nr:DinB family protein [Mycobacterium sp. 852014-52144_SCH5372336]OBB77665.1 maleylpyruvate isomerase [Mycobacterium sp. 852014-52144_SCH5372336]